MLLEVRDDIEVVRRRGVADRVGNIDRGRSRRDRLLDDFAQKIEFRACGVFRRELDVVAERLRHLDMLDGGLHDLLLGHLELVLHVNRTGGEEDMDARLGDPLECFRRSFNVVLATPRETADRRAITKLLGDRSHRFKVAGRGNWEPGLDDINPQFNEGLGHLELLGHGHAATGRLLAIAERRVEDDDVVGHGG